MTEPSAITYRAFLSYSHRDTAWGKSLHAALEGYRIDKDLVGRATAAGALPKTLRPIFRDREDFSAGHSLTAQTLAALEAAQFLIVICSPNAAQSQYVNEEIRRFRAMGRADRLIPVIVDGEPGDPARECFPPALRFKVGPDGEITGEREEPIAADARPQGDGKEVAKLKVVAGLLGVGLDEIVRRAERARRRRLRNWVGALASLTLIFAGLAVWAEFNRREAEAQRLLADQRREQAERNFAVAHEVADSLVFNITKELRDVQGMRPETVQRILARAGLAFQKLVESVGGDNPDVLRSQAGMYVEFGKTYAAQVDIELQLGAARKAVEIMQRLTATDPSNTRWQRDLFVSHIKVGDALAVQGKLTDALTSYRDATAIVERLAKAEPAETKWQSDLSMAHYSVGNVLDSQGKLVDALTSHRASLAIRESLAAAEPDNTDLLEEAFRSYEMVGDLQVRQSNPADALASFRSGLAIAERLAKASPYSARLQHNLALSQEFLAKVLLEQRNLPTALALFRASVAIKERLAAADPGNEELQHDLSVSYRNVGKVLVAQGDVAEARTTYRTGLAIAERAASGKPDNAEWQFDVVVILFQLVANGDDVPGRLTEIVARMRKLKEEGRLAPERARLLQMAEEELVRLKPAPAARR